MLIRFIASTRLDERAFFAQSLLARSLETLDAGTRFVLEPAFAATNGLAPIYNAAIERSHPDDVLVLVHDDVYFDDWHLGARLAEALSRFDIVGIAGVTARAPGQAAWWGTEINGKMVGGDPRLRSGAIKHIKQSRRRSLAYFVESGRRHLPWTRRTWSERWALEAPGTYRLIPTRAQPNHHVRLRPAGSGAGKLDCYGPSPAAVKLLDGVFIAAHAGTLKASAVRFDPRFDYHFYDLDFCRQCEVAGLNLGIWPIALSHASIGAWGAARWHAGKALYFDKWKE